MPEYLRLSDAAKIMPLPVNACTVWRWCVKGFYMRAAKKAVRLEHIVVGRRLLTTQEWIDRFIAELTAAKAAERKKKPGKFERLMGLYEAESVLRRAEI